jgi:hypothetical protein
MLSNKERMKETAEKLRPSNKINFGMDRHHEVKDTLVFLLITTIAGTVISTALHDDIAE